MLVASLVIMGLFTSLAFLRRHLEPGTVKAAATSTPATEDEESSLSGTGRKIPGYDLCDPLGEGPCQPVTVTVEFLDQLLGEHPTLPSDFGLPACPTDVSDPGFSSPEEAEKALAGHEDDPPSCMVHPRDMVTDVWLSPADAKEFRESHECLGTNESPCTTESTKAET